MNRVGNYKLSRTLGEGAFAKVKRKLKIIIFFNSWCTWKNWSKNSCKNNQNINLKNQGISW